MIIIMSSGNSYKSFYSKCQLTEEYKSDEISTLNIMSKLLPGIITVYVCLHTLYQDVLMYSELIRLTSVVLDILRKVKVLLSYFDLNESRNILAVKYN